MVLMMSWTSNAIYIGALDTSEIKMTVADKFKKRNFNFNIYNIPLRRIYNRKTAWKRENRKMQENREIYKNGKVHHVEDV